ncbi:MAG: DMT family transporter [Alphaproteobacteria bacterium]
MSVPARVYAPDAPLRGILCLTLGVCVFVSQDVIIKHLSGGYPLHEMLFIRCITGLPCILAIALWRGDPAAFRLYGAGLVRAALHFLSFSCYYLALAALPLAETSTLYYANPLFITALSVPFLHEAVGPRRWAAVLVGFAGVVVVLRPDVAAVNPAMLLALGAAFFYACSMLVTRRAGGRVPATGFALHSVVLLLVLSAIAGLVMGDGRFDQGGTILGYLLRAWSLPPGLDLALLAATGPISAAGFVLLAEAYRTAPVSLVAPFEYSSLPVAVIAGYVVFGDLPAPATWIGLALIVGAGLYIVHREAAKLRRRG